ncbi:MAG: hypothetical protein V3V67_16825 [Myxococcota bacterium]
MRAERWTALLLVSALLGGAGPAAAEEEPAGEAEVATPPTLDLNRLLMPRITPALETRYGGKDQRMWLQDFERVRSAVADLELKVAAAQEKYREASDAEWGYSPTGGGMPTDPEVLRIRAEIKRDRQSLEAARKRLRELGVEASLAGVPEEWTRAAPR